MFFGVPVVPASTFDQSVLPQADAVVLVDHVEAVDLVDALEALAEEVAGAPRGHDLDLVAAGDQVLEHDARAHRVTHALADHAVEDPHRLMVAPSERGAPRPPRYDRRCPAAAACGARCSRTTRWSSRRSWPTWPGAASSWWSRSRRRRCARRRRAGRRLPRRRGRDRALADARRPRRAMAERGQRRAVRALLPRAPGRAARGRIDAGRDRDRSRAAHPPGAGAARRPGRARCCRRPARAAATCSARLVERAARRGARLGGGHAGRHAAVGAGQPRLGARARHAGRPRPRLGQRDGLHVAVRGLLARVAAARRRAWRSSRRWRAACARRWGARAAISLGVVGAGALGDESAYRNADELAEDVALAEAAGIDEIALFALDGIVARPPREAWLDALLGRAAARAHRARAHDLADHDRAHGRHGDRHRGRGGRADAPAPALTASRLGALLSVGPPVAAADRAGSGGRRRAVVTAPERCDGAPHRALVVGAAGAGLWSSFG